MYSSRTLYPQRKSTRHPSFRRISGPQSRSERDGKEKMPHCPCWELNPGRPAHSLVTLLTELPRLLIMKHTILKSNVLGCGLDSSGSRYGPVAVSCELINRPLVSKKGREFLK
jgi:hypothetical protein